MTPWPNFRCTISPLPQGTAPPDCTYPGAALPHPKGGGSGGGGGGAYYLPTPPQWLPRGGRYTFAPATFICVQSGGRWRPSLHLRGGRTEGLATLNQALMRGMRSCCQVFGGRAHFSDLAEDGGGSHGGADAYFLAQKLDKRSASVYLFSKVGLHSSVVAELFRLIERLEG